jgi:hypothetical protein
MVVMLQKNDAAAAKRIEELLSRAERLTPSGGLGALGSGKGRERADAAWQEVLQSTWAASVASLRDRQSRVEAWAGFEPQAARAVARARQQARAPGLPPAAVSTAALASGHLVQARRLAAAGDLLQATAQAQKALGEADQVEGAYHHLHARFRDPGLLKLWQQWADDAIALSRRRNHPVLVVNKLDRRLDVYRRGHRTAVFPIELGLNGLERKLHAGDRATPEGNYRVLEMRAPGQTRFYKALLLDYPNAVDRRRYRELVKTSIHRGGIGSLIEIHGDGGQGRDWTDGCVALSNPDMDRLFAMVKVTTPVTIVGTYATTDEARPHEAR